MRHEIEHADGSYEVVESRTGERVALATIGGVAIFAMGSLALSFFGGGAGLAAVLGAGGGAPGGAAEASYDAPNQPTVRAAMYEDTAGYAIGSAFVGSLDDTLAYAIYQWDSLRGTGWDLVTPDTQQANGGHPLRSDTLLAELTAADTFKVRLIHHGALSSLADTSAVDTVVASYVASAYDPYLPAAWTDTVHYEDFTGLVANTRFDSISGASGNMDAPWTLETVAFNCHGGEGVSGYGGSAGGLCRGQDSLVAANQASPPWVWESHYPVNEAVGLQLGIVFADGNGSGAAADLTRVYVRYSIFFESGYVWNTSSNKYWSMNGVSNGFMLGWDGLSHVFVGQSSPNTDDCDYDNGTALTANTWVDYYPGDTIETIPGEPLCSGTGTNGWNTSGVWQHRFVCFDFSPAAGSRVISWGMYSEDEQGIAAYHNNVTNYVQVNASPATATDFDGWMWNGTFGGSKTHPVQGLWFDDFLVMTGSSGSCVTPPSFS